MNCTTVPYSCPTAARACACEDEGSLCAWVQVTAAALYCTAERAPWGARARTRAARLKVIEPCEKWPLYQERTRTEEDQSGG